jgi:hypothetical protein
MAKRKLGEMMVQSTMAAVLAFDMLVCGREID